MKRVLIVILVLGIVFSVSSQESKPSYVILISLDGFRYDYVERFKPENLSRFIETGIAADGLIPSFPSKTFPNHYTIATGMKPEHHGLVDNSFYDSTKNLVYTMGNREIVEDGYWYGGTPLWVLAEQNGLKAASYFFVGSEAPVKGVRPSYYYPYDGNVPNLSRVAKVFEWLQLPETERPRLITLYFSDMDNTGHRYGPNNDEKLKGSLDRLDRELGALFEGLKSFDLDINIILVSDHGMANVPKEKLINLDELTEGIDAKVVNNGALAHLYLAKPGQKTEVIEILIQRPGNFKIEDVNSLVSYDDISRYPDRIGDLLILPELGYYLADERGIFRYQNNSAMFKTDIFGEHGYSPEYREMHGIFYANGPAFKEGMRIERFENIHIYPMVCQILGLPIPPEIDGKAAVLAPILKD